MSMRFVMRTSNTSTEHSSPIGLVPFKFLGVRLTLLLVDLAPTSIDSISPSFTSSWLLIDVALVLHSSKSDRFRPPCRLCSFMLINSFLFSLLSQPIASSLSSPTSINNNLRRLQHFSLPHINYTQHIQQSNLIDFNNSLSTNTHQKLCSLALKFFGIDNGGCWNFFIYASFPLSFLD